MARLSGKYDRLPKASSIPSVAGISMHTCSNCGHAARIESRFCGQCGEALQTSNSTPMVVRNAESKPQVARRSDLAPEMIERIGKEYDKKIARYRPGDWGDAGIAVVMVLVIGGFLAAMLFDEPATRWVSKDAKVFGVVCALATMLITVAIVAIKLRKDGRIAAKRKKAEDAKAEWLKSIQ